MLDKDMVNIYYKHDNFKTYLFLDFTTWIKIGNDNQLYRVK